jgi:lipoprotein signal peptidase
MQEEGQTITKKTNISKADQALIFLLNRGQALSFLKSKKGQSYTINQLTGPYIIKILF